MGEIELALCITDLGVGGAERCLVELATRLDRRRFHPVVYCLAAPPGPDRAWCISRLEASQIEVHCLGIRTNWGFPWAVHRLRRLLAAEHPRLVQTFLFHANIVGRIAARLARVPCVVSGIRVAQRGWRWRLWVDRLTNGLVARHVCVSQAVARFSETNGGLPAEKLVVIPNGVDLQRCPAARPADLASLGIPAGHRVVTYVGRLDRQKGVRWLVETGPQWLIRAPDCDLLLVGEGPEHRDLQRLCRELRVSDRVHFAGWRDDVPELLAASHLLVLPSAWEGMPNVVLEAMASRLPVLAADVEGVRELLGPAADRQTVRHGDSEAFTQKLVTLIQQRSLAANLGEANRRRAEENFALSRMVDAYQDLWESLVRG